MNRRAFVFGIPLLPKALSAVDDPDPELSAANSHSVSLKASGTVAQGVNVEVSAEATVKGAMDIPAAIEAAIRALRLEPEVTAARKW